MAAGAAVWAAAEEPAAVSGLGLVGPFVRNAPTNPFAAATFRLLMLRPWARAAWLAYLPQLYPGHAGPRLRRAPRGGPRGDVAPGRHRRVRAHDPHRPQPRREADPEVSAPALVIMGTADPDFSDPSGRSGVDRRAAARA
jgi:hypothetical protein